MDAAELAELESIVVEALATGDDDALRVLGYGEVSVALGWPQSEPRLVCKRTPPFTAAQFATYQQLVAEYLDRLQAAGMMVAPTKVQSINRGNDLIAYLVQPALPTDQLANNVLRASEPDAEHPLLVAVVDTLDLVNPEFSLDAQIANFAWDGAQLVLMDVGTPFLWDSNGAFRLDMTPFARMLPAPVRPFAKRELTKLVSRWNDPRRVGIDIVANLYREDLTEWVDATVAAVNKKLGPGNPVTVDEAQAFYHEDLKLWPALKRAQAIERWWQTTVRRRSYDWFIRSSF